jgi:hypothetical protein
MPAKSGASHASAALVSIILGAVISSYIKVYAEPVARVTETIGSLVVTQVGLPLPEEMSGVLVVVVILSFVWGVAYHIARH